MCGRRHYAVSGRVFLRLLGFIYLLAFASYWVQLGGLIGERGILPAGGVFQQGERDPRRRGVLAVSKCILDGGWRHGSLRMVRRRNRRVGNLDAWLRAVAVPRFLVGRLPFADASRDRSFTSFNGIFCCSRRDFLAIFLSPLNLRLRRAGNPPRPARFLLIWLLFRLVFASGVVKLSSGDPAWLNGTALDYHYFTQPLPTPVAWFAQQLPGWWQVMSVRVMFFVELVSSVFSLRPQALRLVAAGGIAALQVLIALTGNYGFFNLLTLALCLLAVDDAVWSKWAPEGCGPRGIPADQARFLAKPFLLAVAVVIFLLSLVPLAASFRRPIPVLAPLMLAYQSVAPFRTINGYGLFAVMTKERREIVVQGSDDGVTWRTYAFRFKPGDPRRAPGWVAPYMPRLDWQMWFAALGSVEREPLVPPFPGAAA